MLLTFVKGYLIGCVATTANIVRLPLPVQKVISANLQIDAVGASLHVVSTTEILLLPSS